MAPPGEADWLSMELPALVGGWYKNDLTTGVAWHNGMQKEGEALPTLEALTAFSQKQRGEGKIGPKFTGPVSKLDERRTAAVPHKTSSA